MRFESKEQLESLIKGFKERAKELEQVKKDDPNTDKNYNTKVSVDWRIEYDETVQVENQRSVVDGLPVTVCVVTSENCSGDIYVFYFNQPKLIDTIKILSAGKDGNPYEKGLMAWSAMLDEKNSSPEVKTDRIKLGYLVRVLDHIDALLHDQKKS